MIIIRRHLQGCTPSIIAAYPSARRQYCTSLCNLQKSNYIYGATKSGVDEKWGQVAMEYIYEVTHSCDSSKRSSDVKQERRISSAFDRLRFSNEHLFKKRMGKLAVRMSEVLELLKNLQLEEALDEASMMNTEQPPLNFRRPTLTPPLPGYEPGFGMDVPQLKSVQMEYPPITTLTDDIEFSEANNNFPFVEAHEITDLVRNTTQKIESQCGELREASPTTGVEGEMWAARLGLERKALARQQLILDLSVDSSYQEEYMRDESFRLRELQKRGLVPLAVDPPYQRHTEPHFAHEPAYQPIRD